MGELALVPSVAGPRPESDATNLGDAFCSYAPDDVRINGSPLVKVILNDSAETDIWTHIESSSSGATQISYLLFCYLHIGSDVLFPMTDNFRLQTLSPICD
jgi:hypothetical protein